MAAVDYGACTNMGVFRQNTSKGFLYAAETPKLLRQKFTSRVI